MSASSELRPRPPLPGTVPLASRALLAAVLALLVVSAATDLFAVFAGSRVYALVDGDAGFAFASEREFHDAYALYENAGRLQVMAVLPCAIVFVVWFFLMRRSTGLLAPDAFRRGPGWAIWGWLIPVANLWIPYRVAVGMWGACAPLPDGDDRRRTPMWPVNLWWALFVATTLLGRVTAARLDAAEGPGQIRDAVLQYAALDLLYVAAAGAAAFFAIRLTAMQRRKVTEGPYWSGA
ncbi:DUF4328 domain-containing protein [Streptomyces sp. NPDC006610]|uniref:DUF4328 domain-containing protein n=1 Tax=Streptomyces sp. NPDC006610 TaxID=3154584 RepID=UPI0033A78F4A